MPVPKIPGSEPIPGYRLIHRLGKGGFGEVWKCQVPGNIHKALKFVYDDVHELVQNHEDTSQVELEGVNRIKEIKHPYLLTIDRIEFIEGEVLFVMELAEKSLFDLYREYRKAGFVGIPRSQLLGLLHETAELLDLFNLRYDIQHLDIKPQNLLIMGGHVKVADFGLVQNLIPTQEETVPRNPLVGLSPLYASPEMHQRKISRFSDQYSLAVVYQEMLKGRLPIEGKNSRQLMIKHLTEAPDLTPLSEADQSIVARALEKKPENRFPTCVEFIQALRLAEQTNAYKKSISRPANGSEQSVANALRVTENRALATSPDLILPADSGKNGNGHTATSRFQTSASLETSEAYRHVENLSTDSFMSVWKSREPTGDYVLVRYLNGISSLSPRQRDQALKRMRELDHPLLFPRKFLMDDKDRLTSISAVFEQSLYQRFRQCRSLGRPGIPRKELLGYLRKLADGLTHLHQQYSMQHLSLNPKCIFLDHDQVLLDEFGLSQLLWLPIGFPIHRRNKRFSAPELFQSNVSLTSDQYSLALIYHVMLTGQHPHWQSVRGEANSRQPMVDKSLSGSDQEILSKALDFRPENRWADCREFLDHLTATKASKTIPTSAPAISQSDEFTEFISRASLQPRPKGFSVTASALKIVHQHLQKAIDNPQDAALLTGNMFPPVLSRKRDKLTHKFSAGVSLTDARSKLDVVCQLWCGEIIQVTDSRYAFRVTLPGTSKDTTGKVPGLMVNVAMNRQESLEEIPIDISVLVKPVHCSRKQGASLLKKIGVSLVERIRNTLMVNAKHRVQSRVPWTPPLKVQPVYTNGISGDMISCRGKDLSCTGIGFYLPQPLPSVNVTIQMPGTAAEPFISVPATLVWAKIREAGTYEVGALFSMARVHIEPRDKTQTSASPD